MKTLRLDLESIAVETFATQTREEKAPFAISGVPCPTLIQTCTNCLADSCIC
jgi:hypothetical protein